MKNKLLNKKALLLSFFITTAFPVLAVEKEAEVTLGLKKGFFGKSHAVKKRTESKACEERDVRGQSTCIEEALEPMSIWLDSLYYGSKALDSIFERVKMHTTFSEGTEELLRSNLELLIEASKHSDDEIRRVAINNKGLRQSYFYIKALSNRKQLNILYSFCNKIEKTYMDLPKNPHSAENPRIPIIAMQILDHMLMTSIFTSTDPLRDGFITAGSNEERGSLVIDESFCADGNSSWTEEMPKPIIHYYRENADGLKLYRMYFDHTDVYDGIRYLPEHSLFKGYEFTQIQAMTNLTPNDLRLQHTGYLLNKDGTLCEQSGIAFIHRDKDGSRFDGPKAADPVRTYRYYFSPWVGQHTFSLLEYSHTPSRELKELVNLVGGVDKIKQDELVFLPDVNSETIDQPAYNEAVFLLPYLYKLREIDGVSEPLNRAILRIENILIDAEYAEKSADAMIEVEHDIAEQIDKEIEHGSPETIAVIDAKATQLYTAYKRPKPGKKNWGEKSKEARDDAKQQLKEEKRSAKLVALSEEEKTRLKKEKILEKIRASFLARTTDRRHFDSSEVTDMLASMRRSFSRAGVELTGAATTRGSHTGVEVSAAGGSVKLGSARRPQTDGYESGTVRTIINDHVDRILSLVINS